MIAHGQQHLEPGGAVQPAVNRSVVVEDGHNPAGDPGNDQDVEPVARPESPKLFHALKVLGSRPFRLVRENDPNIVREDDTKSPSGPKTAETRTRTLLRTDLKQEDT